MEQSTIDGGTPFDWGRTSPDYAKYRDIYPPAFYRYLLDHGIGVSGQHALDLGTGTGVLPRALAPYGAAWVGLDRSENQIEQARLCAAASGGALSFLCCPAEEMDFPPEHFDVVTACQCLVYFDHARLAPRVSQVLKPGGKFALLYMAWLPGEDAVAGLSERLVLQYNPAWTGCGETRRPIAVPPDYRPYFRVESQDVFDLSVPFTRESWHGRIKTCRGVGASLSVQALAQFEQEHRALLSAHAPESFQVLHYAACTILTKR